MKNAVAPEVFEAAEALTHESSVKVTGKLREDSRAPSGFEMDVTNVEAVQVVPKEDPFPITPKEHGIEFLMDNRHLWIRSTRQRAILKIRHEIIKAVRDFFDDDGFTLCDTPILTPAACEGTTTLFEVGYFRGQSLSDAIRSALQRGDRRGAGQGLYLRSDVSRREVQDPAAPDRVLDGRARSRLRDRRRRHGPCRDDDLLCRSARPRKAATES